MIGRIFLVSGMIFLAACTKEKAEPTHTPDGKPLISRKSGDPEALILEAEINVPKKHEGKIKKSDLILWDVKNEQGLVVASYWGPVPKFPHTLVIRAKHLVEPITKDSHLQLSARIVKFGDEMKPPQKGQLQLFVGAMPAAKDEVVVKPAVSQAVLDKFLKKNPGLALGETIAVGSKVKAQFTPLTL